MSKIVEERRAARIGTVTGLALLGGGTAVAAVAGGAHSVFATVLLGLLTFGLGHSLLVEIKRQARRLSPGWSHQDTVNAILLGAWAEAALILTILETGPGGPDRAVGLALALGYAAACGYFVTERRRAIALPLPPTAADEIGPAPTTGRVQPADASASQAHSDSVGASAQAHSVSESVGASAQAHSVSEPVGSSAQMHSGFVSAAAQPQAGLESGLESVAESASPARAAASSEPQGRPQSAPASTASPAPQLQPAPSSSAAPMPHHVAKSSAAAGGAGQRPREARPSTMRPGQPDDREQRRLAKPADRR